MKRRILLVDDEVAVLLTLKTVLEISGFDVDTATSAREGRSRIKHREYEMVITDMRMEDEHAGKDVIAAAKEAPYAPAIALLTAFPVDDDALMGADKMLVKPMHTKVLLQQLEALFARHTAAKEKAAVKKSSAGKAVAEPAGETGLKPKRAAVGQKSAVKTSPGTAKSATAKPTRAKAGSGTAKAVSGTAKKSSR